MHSDYNKDFYIDQMSGSYESAKKIVPLLLEAFKPKSVLDVGCGLGTWLKVFEENKIKEIYGIDGEWIDTKKLYIKKNNFIKKDLTQSFNLNKKFDICISLEVAEHIEEMFAEVFIENLINHSDIIVFSAAYPNVRGTKHVNLQWPSYWANIFKTFGYHPLDIIRPQIWEDEGIEWWYKQDIIVFIKKSKLELFTKIKKSYPLSIVHPKCFEKYANPNMISLERYLKIFPSVFISSIKRYMKNK